MLFVIISLLLLLQSVIISNAQKVSVPSAETLSSGIDPGDKLLDPCHLQNSTHSINGKNTLTQLKT